MESTQEIIKEILDTKIRLIEKNRQEQTMEKVFRNVEDFSNTIGELWDKLKSDFSSEQHSSEVVSFSEDLANYFLDHVDFYFTHINKNHTVRMGEMIGKVKRKTEGMKISEKLKARLQKISEMTT